MQISSNLFSAGLCAIKTSQEHLANAAQAIAKSNSNAVSTPAASAAPVTQTPHLTEQLIQLEQAKQMNQLGARVLSSADESLGTLIDIQA
ncbi:hypothetical protein [Denitrificimonas caeni]|uniref:hypothetical protein n=1 Tax=Denitrificimonas caeni TaxID=521720 RepID=UPI0019650C5B|nr:hypothetical protein [Denitrificimonas caeni]